MFTFKAPIANLPPPPFSDCLAPVISGEIYAVHDCYEWALLEAESMDASCTGHISVPFGWQLAPNDDRSRAAILAVGPLKWSRAACLVVAGGASAFNSSNASPCSVPFSFHQLEVKSCWRTDCKHRILIRSISPLSTCGFQSGDLCSPSSSSRILSRAPAIKQQNQVWPFAANLDLTPDQQPVVVNLEIPIPAFSPVDVRFPKTPRLCFRISDAPLSCVP